MTRYISKEAQEIIHSPTEGETVTLLLGVDDALVVDAIRQLQPHEAHDVDYCGHSTIRATVPETSVEAIEQLPMITTVEVEGTIELLNGPSGSK